jgi:hypothetical protein
MTRRGLLWINILLLTGILLGLFIAIFDVLRNELWGLGFISISITCGIMLIVINKMEQKSKV